MEDRRSLCFRYSQREPPRESSWDIWEARGRRSRTAYGRVAVDRDGHSMERNTAVVGFTDSHHRNTLAITLAVCRETTQNYPRQRSVVIRCGKTLAATSPHISPQLRSFGNCSNELRQLLQNRDRFSFLVRYYSERNVAHICARNNGSRRTAEIAFFAVRFSSLLGANRMQELHRRYQRNHVERPENPYRYRHAISNPRKAQAVIHSLSLVSASS